MIDQQQEAGDPVGQDQATLTDEWTPSQQLVQELNATIATVTSPSATRSSALIERLTKGDIPDEVKELIIRPSVTVSVVDTRPLQRAKVLFALAPDVKRAMLQPFKRHTKLLEIATDEFYEANVFIAGVLFYTSVLGGSYHVFADDWTERNNIRHLDLEMPFKLTQTSVDPNQEPVIGPEHRRVLSILPGLYPQLRTLRILLKHDPKHCGPRIVLQGSKQEVTAWESRCLLTSIVQDLRAYTSPHLRSKEVRFDQTTHRERVTGVNRRPVEVDGRVMSVDEVVWTVLDWPLSLASI
ncbi:hypothetical protein LTR85_007159 [Meristemomyces frigidus]|nr:hypothetical protein LTR85_007159 [Meristemomyces frigidus]